METLYKNSLTRKVAIIRMTGFLSFSGALVQFGFFLEFEKRIKELIGFYFYLLRTHYKKKSILLSNENKQHFFPKTSCIISKNKARNGINPFINFYSF